MLQNYAVVFETPTNAKEAYGHVKAEIVFISLSALLSCLACAQLTKFGLNISFQLSYLVDEEDEIAVLDLGNDDCQSIVQLLQ
jgi:hypothetical protein